MTERRLVLVAIFALGVSAVVTQLVLLRESLGAFAGNELVLGIVLGNWLLLTGLGSWVGRWLRPRQLPALLILVAVLPVLEVVALRLGRDAVFTRGALVGVTETFFATFVLLAPFCVVSGAMLTVACRLAAIAPVYVADSLGSIAGGVLFSFGLVFVCDHLTALCVPATLCLAVAIVLAARRWERLLAVTLLAALPVMLRGDAWTTGWQYPGQHVIFRGNSPYGRLVVTEVSGQRNFFQNGVPLFSTANTAQVEETVHYAMAQRPAAKRVLLLGGGVTGTARELRKYPAAVTYVELDPLILRATGETGVTTDGRRFVRRTTERFDVVIVDLPEPATLGFNRFYTAEFFAEVKRVLSGDGVLAFALGRYENYVSPELGRLLSAANTTLRGAFRHTLLIPGGRVYLLASDGGLTVDIAARVPPGTQWVNQHYLAAQLTSDRLADLQRAASLPARVNRDFEPVLFREYLRHWLSEFPVRFGLLEGGLVLVLLVYVARLRGPPVAVFAGGFAASALEVVLLLAFQVAYGSVYRGLGLIVTVFMAGLAVGAWWGMRRTAGLVWLALVIAGLAAVLPWTMRAGWMIAPLTFVLAGVVGMQFAVAGKTGTASRLYTADFVGAALGALLASTLLIPVLGVAATCWVTAGLNVVAAMVMRCGGRETTS